MTSLYKPLGFVFVGLAVVGIFLPLVPTTPFLILAAGCFARSSEKLHHWLLSNSTFGPIINDWEQNKCVSRSTKTLSLSCIVLFGGYAVAFALTAPLLRLLGLVVIFVSLSLVARLKVCDRRRRAPAGRRKINLFL